MSPPTDAPMTRPTVATTTPTAAPMTAPSDAPPGPRRLATVLKGPGLAAPPPGPPRVVRAEVFAASAEARRLLAEAQGRADALVAEARGQAGAIARQAREEGLAEGRSQAAEALARATLQAGHLLAEAEPRAVELALEIAARLLGRDLERDPALVAELSATALQAARRARAVVLRVHPLDARRLREHRPRLMALIGRAVDVTLRDDDQVQPGGCVVETEFGTIDGQLRTRFELLRALLLPAAPAPEAR